MAVGDVVTDISDTSGSGTNLVTNGNFDADSDWVKTDTWEIRDGYAYACGNGDSQYLSQDFSIKEKETYIFEYEIIINTLNGGGASLSGTGGFGSVPISSTIGKHRTAVICDDAEVAYALKIGVSGTSNTGCIKIDNVSLSKISADDIETDLETNRAGASDHIVMTELEGQIITATVQES